MTWRMLLDGNKHFNDSGSYIGIQMENIVFSRINTTPGFASLISFMATKVGVIVVDLLWWRAGSHVLVPKVCLLQMKVGILIMFSTTFFLGNTWCLKYRCVVSFAKPPSKSEAQPDHKVLADLYLFLFLRWGEHPRRPAWSDGCRCKNPVRKRNHSPSEEWFVTNCYSLAPAFSRVIMGLLDPQPDQKKTVYPVCFIACLHPRLVQSTCGSYAWERKEIGYFCAKMLVESSITLLLIHVYSYGHLPVMVINGIIHSINGVISTYNW